MNQSVRFLFPGTGLYSNPVDIPFIARIGESIVFSVNELKNLGVDPEFTGKRFKITNMVHQYVTDMVLGYHTCKWKTNVTLEPDSCFKSSK